MSFPLEVPRGMSFIRNLEYVGGGRDGWSDGEVEGRAELCKKDNGKYEFGDRNIKVILTAQVLME